MKHIQIEHKPDLEVKGHFGRPALYVDLLDVTHDKCTCCKNLNRFPKYYIDTDFHNITFGCFTCSLISKKVADEIADDLNLIMKMREI